MHQAAWINEVRAHAGRFCSCTSIFANQTFFIFRSAIKKHLGYSTSAGVLGFVRGHMHEAEDFFCQQSGQGRCHGSQCSNDALVKCVH